MAYRITDPKARWKAVAAVIAVHMVLGLVIVTGLNVEIVGRAVERLEAFDISLPDPPVAAAPVAGTGTASSAGAASAGTGTGAGATGTGRGGGGSGGAGAGSTPARLTRNLTRSDYRRLAGSRLPEGSAALAVRVARDGRVDSCRVIRSSGNAEVDAGLCPLVTRRLRFAPARDPQGRPIPYFTNYFASWSRR